jgi:hypothetical protein
MLLGCWPYRQRGALKGPDHPRVDLLFELLKLQYPTTMPKLRKVCKLIYIYTKIPPQKKKRYIPHLIWFGERQWTKKYCFLGVLGRRIRGGVFIRSHVLTHDFAKLVGYQRGGSNVYMVIQKTRVCSQPPVYGQGVVLKKSGELTLTRTWGRLRRGLP